MAQKKTGENDEMVFFLIIALMALTFGQFGGSDVMKTEDVPQGFRDRSLSSDSPLADTMLKDPDNPILEGSARYFKPHPQIIKDGDIYYMTYGVYDQNDSPVSSQLWLATSSDGKKWSESPSNPIIARGTDGEWDSYRVNYHCMLKDGPTWKVWYSGGSHKTAYIGIGYASGDSLTSLSKYGENPVLTPSNFTSPPSQVLVPLVWKEGDTDYRMLFHARIGVNGGIYYAESNDGLSWAVKNNEKPVLDYGSSGEWDDVRITPQSIVRIDGIYYLLYAGWNGKHYRLALAYSKDLSSWTKHATNPISKVGSVGEWDDRLGGDHGCFIKDTSDNVIGISGDDRWWIYYSGEKTGGTQGIGRGWLADVYSGSDK